MAYLSELMVIGILFVVSFICVLGTKHFTILDAGGLPGPGLWPVSIGILLAVFCILNLLEAKGKRAEADTTIYKEGIKRVLLFFTLAFVLSVFGTGIVGMIPSMGFILLISLMLWYNRSIMASLGITVLVIILIFVIFVAWLRVPFPLGLFE